MMALPARELWPKLDAAEDEFRHRRSERAGASL
jgi:hypothetical protein